VGGKGKPAKDLEGVIKRVKPIIEEETHTQIFVEGNREEERDGELLKEGKSKINNVEFTLNLYRTK